MTQAALTIEEYLANKGVRVFKASGPEVTCWCFFCGRHQRDKGRLYINTDEGVFYCQVCQESGTFNDILAHFGDPVTTVASAASDRSAEDLLARRRILNAAVACGRDMLLNNDEVMLWLIGKDRAKKQRGLSVETVEDYRLGFLARGWTLTRNLTTPHTREQLLVTGLVHLDDDPEGKSRWRKGDDFFRGPKVLIPYLSSGNCVQMRGRDYPDGKYQTGPGEDTRLFNADKLRSADEAVICEGEFDCLVLQQALALSDDPKVRKIAVVGIPGAGIFPRPWADYFRHCKRVYVALDPDDAGKKGAAKIKELLGARARIVDMPEHLPKCDWTEYLVYQGHTWRDAVALLRASGSSGRMGCSFSDAIDSWQKVEANGATLPTGFKQLDAVIDGGGMRAGTVTVPAAKTSVGKTLFAHQIVVNHKRLGLDVPTLFVSLELTRAELAERMVRQHRFYEPNATLAELGRRYDETMMICDRNRLGNRELAALIEEFDEERGCLPALVVVDYLGYFARGQNGGSQYEKSTNAIMEMKALAKETDAVFIVPSQVSRGAKEGERVDADDLRDSGAIEETADYGIGLWRPDDKLEPGQQVERTGAVQASLFKNRRGPKNQSCRLVMALGSLTLVDPSDQRALFLANAENRKVWAGKTYADIRAESAQMPLQMVVK